MNANAEILLVRSDGAVILQVRDNKPGISNPGLISSFGGHIEPGEEPIDAAVREINEETNLDLIKDRLQFYRKCRKTREVHGEDWDVYYFAVGGVSEEGLEVYEGAGYTIIHNKEELAQAKTTVLLREVLTDYFDGFRKFVFFPDMDDSAYQKMFDKHYAKVTAGKQPSVFAKPVALACTGFVAAGKSTITGPLADQIGAVRVSTDLIREEFYQAGYNFKRIRQFVANLINRLLREKYNIFLDFNISTNMPTLDDALAAGYRIFVVHANPPESFIKNKILSGSMKHELSFFPKDEHLYTSMLGWREDHIAALPVLRQKYGIWYEADTSRPDLPKIIRDMQNKLAADLGEKPPLGGSVQRTM